MIMQDMNIENKFIELESISNIGDRIIAIHEDIVNNILKYQDLAEDNPQRLFDLLGGDEGDIRNLNWASEYSYEDYIQEKDLDFDQEEEDEWDLEEKSIEHAHDTGHWYVTGACTIKGPNNIELDFEFEYCEGYLEGIIGTPYNADEQGDHGFLFF